MRTVSFSNRKVQSLLNNYFVNTFTNTEGDPTACQSIKHSPDDSAGNCIRGNGKQNVQTIFMTPAGEIFHVATGYIPPHDLMVEIQFAGNLFAALQKNPDSSGDVVADAHRGRLAELGFSENEINSRDGFEQFMMMPNGNNGFNSSSSSPDNPRMAEQGSNPFARMIRGQFLADNKFSIRNPLMTFSSLQRDPRPLVGNGTSFFSSQSSGSGDGSRPQLPAFNLPNFNGSGKR